MINWEEVNQAENMEKLKEAKRWLFQENMRLENEKKAFFQYRDKFLDERVKLREEITALNKRTVMERKRLKQENLFFEKKMAILTDGFKNLEEDRKKFEAEKHAYRIKQAHLEEKGSGFLAKNIAEILFGNITNPIALRKRYRDLVKIYHPDNLFGDEDLAQQINKEYLRRIKDE